MEEFYIADKDIINKIVHVHKESENVISLAIIGSFAKNMFEMNSDVDLLILTKNNTDFSMTEDLIKGAEINSNLIASDDIFVLTESANRISLAYREENLFLDYINDITCGSNLESCIKPWVIGGAIPEVLLLDIESAIICFDKTKKLTQLSEKLKKGYPNELRKSLIEFLYPWILQKIELIESNININCFTMAYAGFYELQILYIRYMLAFYNKFNPGIKHIFKRKLLMEYEKLSIIHDWNEDRDVDASKIESRVSIIKKNIKETYNEYRL